MSEHEFLVVDDVSDPPKPRTPSPCGPPPWRTDVCESDTDGYCYAVYSSDELVGPVAKFFYKVDADHAAACVNAMDGAGLTPEILAAARRSNMFRSCVYNAARSIGIEEPPA